MKRSYGLFALLVVVAATALAVWLSSLYWGTELATLPTPAATTPPITTTPITTLQSPVSNLQSPPTPTAEPLIVTIPEALNLDAFAPDAPLILEFSRPMDVETEDAPLLFEPEVEGRTSWNEARTQLVFTPVDTFSYGRIYTVTLAEGVRAADGETFAQPQRWQLRVPHAPKVLGRSPSTLRLTDLQPLITLDFDRPMNGQSVVEALAIEPALAMDFSWRENTLLMTPEERLLPGVDYTFMLGRTATDANDVPLASSYDWRYRPAPVVNTIRGPSATARQKPLQIVFNYAMDRESVAEALEIEPSIEWDWLWEAGDKVAVISPTVPLENETEYLFHFAGSVRDSQGNELPMPDEPYSLVTPPAIVSHSPTGSDVNQSSLVRIRFDRPMDEAATAAAFHLEPETPGTISWEETTLIFQPDGGNFAEQVSYTVSVTADARGANGEQVLKDDYTWVFTTGRLTPIASFGDGPNAHVLDAGGRRAVQFSLEQESPAAITFELYELTLEQYLDRYSSGFRGVAGTEDRPIDTSGTTLAHEWTVTTANSPVQGSNVQEALIPADVPPGLYILNMRSGRLNDQLILALTRYTVMVKQAEGQLVAWVTDINGGPVAGAEVAVYARDGELAHQGVAGENGVFRADIGAADPQPLIVIAGIGDDRTASGLSDEWRSRGASWGWWWPAPQALDFAAHVYTDRPIYRPGQEVFYKAIIRQYDDAFLSNPPEGTIVAVRIRDARNNVVQTAELRTNALGTVNGSFQLAEGAMLGEWMVEVALDEENHQQVFKVEEYRKPDYEVTVTAEQDSYVAGDVISVTVESLYYLGEPVANAAVEIRLFDLYPSYNYSPFGEMSVDSYYWSPAGFPSSTTDDSVRGETDENGRISLTLPAEGGDENTIYDWQNNLHTHTMAVEATIDDGSRQTVSGFAVVKIVNVSERISLDTGGYLHQPGVPFPISVSVEQVAGEAAGQPAAGRTVTLSLRRWNESGGSYSTVLQSVELTTGEDGRAALDFTAVEPGYYQMLVEGVDSGNRRIAAETYVFIYSDTTDLWYGQYSSGLRISADREQYAPGETARLLIESDFSGPALLTFERGTTRREQLVQLTEPVTAIDVTIQPDDAPNIYVTVNVWKSADTALTEYTYESLPDADLFSASVDLSVPVTNKTLNVTITPDREGYGPREEATFTVRVTNQAGEPVSADLSLAMVDEAIYALSEELAGPIFDAFYYERPNIVRTYDALSPRRTLLALGMGGGGDGMMFGGPRRDYPDTAEWFPTLLTDANGEARVTITLPDSLTTWRLTAKAVTADTQVGEAVTTITTQQAIVVRPILPRGLTAGDHAALTALIHNYSDATQTITVTLREAGTPLLHLATADGRPLADDESQSQISSLQSPVSTLITTQTITLEPGARGLVGWPVVAREPGETAVIVEATAGDGWADAVQLPLLVRPLAVPEVSSQVGEFGAELVTTVEWPAGALPVSSVRLELSRSVAGTLLEGLDYLTGFPYGCVEQTMSKALPNAVVGRAFFQLGAIDPTIEADLPAMINVSLQRLYGFQHNDGGWGWWYDDRSDDYQTAWVVFGLATIAEAGYEVDPGVMERGITWLSENLAGMDLRTQAYAVYAMSVAAKQPGEELESEAWRVESERLGELVEELDTFSRAAVALALYEAGDQVAAEEILALLAESVTETENGRAHWAGEEYDGYYHQKTMSSVTRSTALALSAFARIDPGHSLQTPVARWLVDQRQPQGWGTTNETSYAILGLTDYLLASGEINQSDTSYTVTVNGIEVTGGRLGQDQPIALIDIPANIMNAGNNEIAIRHDGAGPLYYTLSSRVLLEQDEIVAAGNVEVERSYLDSETGEPIETITAGQLVEVRLTIDLAEDKTYLLVEDNLPGGLEALNERLNTTSHVVQTVEEPVYYWEAYGYNHKEIRDGRVTFFITEVSEGRHQYTYLARATHTGEFAALPAEAWAMYDLTTWGRSESSTVVITP